MDDDLAAALAGIATTAVLCLVFSWNDYAFAATFAGPNSQTLPIAAAQLNTQTGLNWGQLSAIGTIVVLPMMVVGLAVMGSNLARNLAYIKAVVAEVTGAEAGDVDDGEFRDEACQLLGLRAGARKEVSALDRATSRLRAGTYGRCVSCGHLIPDARLEALPAAETCLNCATRPRRRRGGGDAK